jgi:PAS domain S-box-containing protein
VEELTTALEELHTMHEELTQSQQAALMTQQRYQELFEWVGEAYLVTDLQGLIVEANQIAAYLFHLDRPQLLGLALAVCIAWEERRAFRNQLACLQHGMEVREWIICVQPPHHPAMQVACHVAPVRDNDERLVGLRWRLRDLTAQQTDQETLAQHVRELTAKLDRAEWRMRELHHRMKNNLQVVATLLDWQGECLQDPRAHAIFQACQGRLHAMALVHELLYRAGDVEHIELGPYLRRLALQVFEAYGVDRERIHLTWQADAVDVGANTAMPCGLLVHEVLSNGLLHAFPAQPIGSVAITLQAEPAGQVILTICDTGIGVPPDLDGHEGESLGLDLIRALTEQLQGTLVVTRTRGTCVTLRFPVEQSAPHLTATVVTQN